LPPPSLHVGQRRNLHSVRPFFTVGRCDLHPHSSSSAVVSIPAGDAHYV
jgi:hypothetical protein